MATMLGLMDVMPFGKHKGKTIQQIYQLSGGEEYLCWMRKTRLEDNADKRFFADEVHALLDTEIAESRELRKKYMTWPEMLSNCGKTPLLPESAGEPPPPPPEVVYDSKWGAF